MVNRNAIRVKSEELEIPFGNVLSGYGLESVLDMIVESSYGKDMWLCNGSTLGINIYKTKSVHKLFFKYKGKEEQNVVIDGIAQIMKLGLEKLGFVTENVHMESREKQGHILWQGYLEEMFLPIHIYIEEDRGVQGIPVEENVRLFMDNNRTILVRNYPLEQSIAIYFMEMFHDLELINHMEYYRLAYEILKKYPLEGRRVKDELEKQCEKMHVAKSEKPYGLWKTYKEYPYMEKKWKAHLRKEKTDSPEWKEMFSLLNDFIEPIWDAICRNEIFFADWMPEIQRFLD